MVGYYKTEPIPSPAAMSVSASGPVGHETMNPVKNLVCSPDLSAFTSRSAAAAAAASATADPLAGVKDEKPYQCLLCQKNFEQKSLYQSHLRSHGKEGEDPYRCNICNKTFAVPARLTRHYRTHTGEKPYQCEYCNKSFSVKENLSVHRRIHTKERPYKCDVCERAFEHSGKLHRHMRIHTGERPHKCTVCSKTFIQSGQLVIHMRTHTGEKPYVCKACGKGFTCSKQLKVHTRTHTGEKPYTCDICGKSFGYNHVLKLHQVAHYGEKVYKCTLCHETFGSKKTMELHIKTHSDSPSSTGSPRDSPIEPVIEISPSTNPGHGPANNQPVPILGSPATPEGCTTDKENLKTEETCHTEPAPYPSSHQQRDFSYYLYPRDQYSQPATPVTNSLAPTLLSSVAEEKSFQSGAIVATPVEPPHMFLYPEMSPAYTTFGLQSTVPGDCSSLLNLPGNDARRRVEAALEAVEEERQREYGMKMETEYEMKIETEYVMTVETEYGAKVAAAYSSRLDNGYGTKVEREPILTPPSSNPVSPAPSPDPLDLAIPVRETLILPPRKRCKMILESMESERTGLIAAQRQSSVIQFARAS